MLEVVNKPVMGVGRVGFLPIFVGGTKQSGMWVVPGFFLGRRILIPISL
jgi:hypothetical protein